MAGSGTLDLTADGLYYKSSTASTFAGAATGGGGVEVDGGSLTLSGVNTFTGGATVGNPSVVAAATLALASSTGNTYSGGTFVFTDGTLLAENTSGSATGSDNVTLNGGTLGSSTTGFISGTVVGGTAAHTIEPGGAGIGNLSIGGLTANANTTLEFNLGSGGTSSLLTLGSGGMTETGAVPVTIGTLPSSPGYYKIITGDLTGLTAASFSTPAAASGFVYLIDATHDPGYIDLDMLAAPTVTANPTPQTVNAGSTASFTAAANGFPAPAVQWEMSSNGGLSFSPISGATSATYSFTAISGQNGNQYEAVFTNAAGSGDEHGGHLDRQFGRRRRWRLELGRQWRVEPGGQLDR